MVKIIFRDVSEVLEAFHYGILSKEEARKLLGIIDDAGRDPNEEEDKIYSERS